MEYKEYEIVEEEVEFYRHLLIDYLKERNALNRELKQSDLWKEHYKEKIIVLEKEIETLNNEISSLKTTLAVMCAF